MKTKYLNILIVLSGIVGLLLLEAQKEIATAAVETTRWRYVISSNINFINIVSLVCIVVVGSLISNKYKKKLKVRVAVIAATQLVVYLYIVGVLNLATPINT